MDAVGINAARLYSSAASNRSAVSACPCPDSLAAVVHAAASNRNTSLTGWLVQQPKRINPIERVVGDVSVPVQRLRIAYQSRQQVWRREPSHPVHVIPRHRVVIARLCVPFEAGELPLGRRVHGVPAFAEREMSLAADSAPRSVRILPHRQVVGVMICRGRARNRGQQLRSRIHVLLAQAAVRVLRNHLPSAQFFSRSSFSDSFEGCCGVPLFAGSVTATPPLSLVAKT